MQRKLIIKKAASVVVIIVILYLLSASFACGFRWPSNYVLTNHVITYIYGFVPRSLVGTIGNLIFGYKWYSWKYMSFVIMAVGGVFVLWSSYEIVRSGYKFKNPGMLTLMAVFAVSPFARYYLHEMGYYEQYGYVLLIIILLFFLKDRIADVYIIPALAGILSLVISESNAFLVLPVFFVYSFICIVNDERPKNVRERLKHLAVLAVIYIPHVIYTVLIWVIKVPEEKVIRLQDHDRDMVNNGFGGYNFVFREDVHLFLSGDRSNADKWERQLHPVHMWIIFYCIIVIVLTMYFLYRYKNSKKLILTYLISSVAAGFAAYIIVLVGWDLDRYFFNMFMSIFFVSAFVLKKYLSEIDLEKRDIILMVLLFIAALFLGGNRLELFDDAVYNENWSQFLIRFTSKLG